MTVDGVTATASPRNLFTGSDTYLRDIFTGTSLTGNLASIVLKNTGSDTSVTATASIISYSGCYAALVADRLSSG